MDPLTTAACRVLGSLLEKEVTVPATYPLTLNALVSACNQTSSRDPVLSLTEADVTEALTELREAGIARVVHASHGARSAKYRQVADEVLRLEAPDRALLTVLLLRGPQTPGELRSRTERLHGFTSTDDVVEALSALAARPEPLVERLAKGPGQREHSWVQLLGGPPGAAAAVATTAVGTPARTEIVVPAEAAALAAFAGTWRGGGRGFYPTIESFSYTEEIGLLPVPGKPFLVYRSTTRAPDGRPLHAESGYLRAAGEGGAELVVAQGSGLVEVGEGVVDGGRIELVSTLVSGTATAKEVTATQRRYQVRGDELSYEIDMAAVGQPMTPHLEATLRRA